jgi:hypothetical protein
LVDAEEPVASGCSETELGWPKYMITQSHIKAPLTDNLLRRISAPQDAILNCSLCSADPHPGKNY